jgi:hypothetical protein
MFRDPGYLFRHHNKSTRCFYLTKEAIDAEAEIEHGNQNRMEGGEEDSDTSSTVANRIIDEHDRASACARKRGRPECDEFCEEDLDDKLVVDGNESSSPEESVVAEEEDHIGSLVDDDMEMEPVANWASFDWKEDFDKSSDEDDQQSLDEIKIVEQEEQLPEEDDEEQEGVAEHGSQLNQDGIDSLNDCFQGIFVSHQNHLKKAQVAMNQEEKAAVRLLKILKQAKAPLYVYDNIVKWATKAAANGVFKNIAIKQLPTKDTILKATASRFNMEGLVPITTAVHLPNANISVNVTTFDAEAVFLSLLSDPVIFNEDNILFFNRENPLAPPPQWDVIDKSKHILGDLNTGKRYHDTYHLRCNVHGRDFLFPLLIFQDKTHHDKKGNLCSEPLLLGFAGLDYRTRMKPEAWRPLGFVPNQNVHPVAKTAEGKLSDVHVVMKHILGGVLKLQKSDVRWHIPHPSHRGKIGAVLKIPILNLLGDNEGLDKICGHLTNKTMVAGVCRKCQVPMKETGNPDANFPAWNMSAIAKLIEEKDIPRLKECSHYLLSHGNAYRDADFGSSSCGVNGSSPADSMHTRHHGSIPYYKAGLFSMYRLSPKTRKIMAPQVVCNEETGKDEPPTQIELDKVHVFAPKMVRMVEHIFIYYGRMLTHQSDRDIYRTYFPQGLTKVTKINAHEQPGTLLDILLMLSSKFGRYWFDSPEEGQVDSKKNQGLMGPQRLADQLFMAEEMLLLDELCRKDLPCEFAHSQLPMYMPGMMKRYNECVDRKFGMGMGFLKNHVNLHLPEEIIDNASPRNTDSELGEAAHKTVLKAPAQNTQKRSSLLDSQVANQYMEGLLVDRASREIDKPKTKTPSVFDSVARPTGRSFNVTTEGIVLVENLDRKAAWPDKKLQVQVESMFRRTILPCIDTISVALYNSCKINDVLYRADPTYKGGNEGWHDWAYMNRGELGIVPAHIMCFAMLEKGSSPFKIQDYIVEESGLHAVCHSLTGRLLDASETDLPHPESRIVMAGKKDCFLKRVGRFDVPTPKLFLYPVNRIVGPCLAVPDVEYVVHQTKSEKRELTSRIRPSIDQSHLFILPREKWLDKYMLHIRNADTV